VRNKILQIVLLAVALVTLVIYLHGAPQENYPLVILSGASAFGFITLRILK
jgi:hypothetical protein